jgi:hypothetical protein
MKPQTKNVNRIDSSPLLRIASVCVVLTIVCCGVAQATPKLVRTTPPFVGGYYTLPDNAKGVAQIQFFVSGNGSEIVGGHRSNGNCIPSAALVATGVQSSDPITFYFPHSIPISPSGAFSATELVTMTPSETQSTVGASGTISISGHFIKGKIVSYRTTAVTGTVNASSICTPTTPKRLVLQWDINNI